jgi:prophage maintenance system killer protein
MWYPTLPDLLVLHERICTVRDLPATVRDMSVVDEAILAPQRTGGEERRPKVIAKKAVALLLPLLSGEAFEHCGDRVAFSITQRFVDRNGFVLKATMSDLKEHVHGTLDDAEPEALSAWLRAHLGSRFDASHTTRIFGALNTLAEVKEDLERVPGFHEDVDRIDGVGYVIAHHIAALFRLDEDARHELADRYPVFAAAWQEALEEMD